MNLHLLVIKYKITGWHMKVFTDQNRGGIYHPPGRCSMIVDWGEPHPGLVRKTICKAIDIHPQCRRFCRSIATLR